MKKGIYKHDTPNMIGFGRSFNSNKGMTDIWEGRGGQKVSGGKKVENEETDPKNTKGTFRYHVILFPYACNPNTQTNYH